MSASKASKKSSSRKPASSRTAGKKGAGKKTAGKKRSSPGMFSKAKHMVGAVLMGAATGAVTGAVKGAIEAGGEEVGIPKESKKKDSSQKGIAEEPKGK